MIHRQSVPSLYIHKLERELKSLHHQLTHKDGLIWAKDNKIQELEKLISELQSAPNNKQQDRPEGCLSPFGRLQGVSRVECSSGDREEMDVGLQLAAEKEQELGKARVQLQEKDQVIAKLYSQAFILHKKMLAQDNAMCRMEEQIKQMGRNNQLMNRLSCHKQQPVLETAASDLQVEGGQGKNIILQNIMVQNQKSKKESQNYYQAKMANQLAIEAMTQESDTMKKAINNYDWKLFCLQTELQLALKDRTRFKEDNQAKDRQINQYEVQVQQLNDKLITLQEELHLLSEENTFFQMQISQKQIKIQELLIEIQNLKDNQENQDLKELTYSNKEKDDELKEMTKFLKEKISENHSLKVKCSQLESSIEQALKKKEKAQFENYYLQERFEQHQEDIQKQLEQIQAGEREIDELDSLSKTYLLRVQELQKQTQIMQGIIYEQQQKLSELVEQKKCLQKQIQYTSSELSSLQGKLNDLAQNYQKETNHLNMLILTKDKQIQKIVRKMESLQLSLKSKEKTIQILKSELKTANTDLKETRFINHKYQQELEEMQEVIAVNQEKLKILKRETVGNIESEVNYEMQLENAHTNILSLELENKTLQARQKSREEAMNKLKKQLSQLKTLTHSKIHQITSYLANSNLQLQETTTFQILVDDQSFEVPLSAIQKQRMEIKKKMSDYCQQFQAFCLSSATE